MKRLLVLVFAVALLVSCKKTRSVYFQAVMASNTNIFFYQIYGNLNNSSNIYMNSVISGVVDDEIPIPVGELSSTGRHNAEKGDNISLSLNASCDSSMTTTDTIQCDFEILLGFFVDDVLTEERIISHSGIGWGGDILLGTIDFTVP